MVRANVHPSGATNPGAPQETPVPNVVTYCRVSSDEQAEKDNSIPAQRKALRAWVAQNPAHALVEEFVDEGISAYAPADRRPGFCEMVSYCRKHDVDVILVHKLDRFSRNREESILFMGLLRKHGVQVKSATEQFDPESPQGFLYEGMIEVVNQFYSMNLGTETLKGMRENASRGWVNGGFVPYGYKRAAVLDAAGREHFSYALGDNEHVQVVRDIFAMATDEGLGLKAIAGRLNSRGVPAPRTAKWSSSTLNALVNNPVYMGDIVWMKSKKKGRRGRAQTDEDERIVARDAHPAIISRETFELRKTMASKRTFAVHTSPHRSVSYLLGRLIRCDGCGSNFVGRRREYTDHRGERVTSLAYYCSGYVNKGASMCKSLPLDVAWIDGAVISALQARFVDPEGWSELERRVRERIEARRRKYGADPKAVEAKVRELERKIENYFNAIGDGLDPALCQARIAELESKKAAIEGEARTIAEEDYYTSAVEKNLHTLGEFRRRLSAGFEQLPFGVQRQVVLAFIESIHVHDRREVVINLKVGMENDGLQHLCDELDAVDKTRSSGRSGAVPELADSSDLAEGRHVRSGTKVAPPRGIEPPTF